MDPIKLATEIAEAFGLVAEEVIAFVRQKHPELRDPPPADGEARVNAAVNEELKAK